MSQKPFSVAGTFTVALALSACAGAAVVGCSSQTSADGPDAGDARDAGSLESEATLPPPGDDASVADAPDEISQSYVRIAHVSPDAPPFDVCAAPHGTTAFLGPLLGNLVAGLVAPGAGSDSGDAGPRGAGVSYAQVSAYVPLPAGPYDVRIVAAGASSCDAAPDVDAGADAAPGLPDWTNLPAFAPDRSTTLLVAGDLSPSDGHAPLRLSLLTDDAVLAGGAASLRVINAMPAFPSLDFGLARRPRGSPSSAAWRSVPPARRRPRARVAPIRTGTSPSVPRPRRR